MKKAYALGLLTVLFWSTSATAFKISLAHLDVLQLLFYAIVTAVLVLGGFLVATRRLGALFSMDAPALGRALVLGFLNPFVYYWMAVKAYDLLPAQVVQPINYTWVITLTLLSVPLLKQPLRSYQIIAALVCYCGVVVISRDSGTPGMEMNYWGVFLAVSCTVIWALYWIYNVKSQADPLVGIFCNFLFSLPFCGLACALLSDFSISHVHGLYGAVWVGVFEFGLAFITWVTALRLARDNTHGVTNLIFLTPFVSLVFIHFILGEALLIQTWIGLGLILSGILFQKWFERKSM
ncbi:MAG: DMT family transporter [Desulfobacterales bacterium]|nr:DMT family transporter [Desulfobacterales bacterium]